MDSSSARRPRAVTDPHLIEPLNELIRRAGGNPEQLAGKLVREMMHTATKMLGDGADAGQLKLTSRSLKELRYAMKVFRPYRGVPKISVFGSARTPDDHPDYQAAQHFSRQMAENGWMVITGAGGGIMRAGQGGAGRESSFGVAIRLPFEVTANEYIEGDHKLVVFRYFFTRKLMFVSEAHAVALFPGGFGTLDECFETMTLMQTGKTPLVPVVLVDPPGRNHWETWERHVRESLLADGMISPEDLNLYAVVNDPDEAVRHVLGFYRNYHSQRYVHDDLVIRMQRALTPDQVVALNDRFAGLVAEGQIQQCGPLDTEKEHLERPRLRFVFTRRDYGRLRLLIDQINAYDALNHPEVSLFRRA